MLRGPRSTGSGLRDNRRPVGVLAQANGPATGNAPSPISIPCVPSSAIAVVVTELEGGNRHKALSIAIAVKAIARSDVPLYNGSEKLRRTKESTGVESSSRSLGVVKRLRLGFNKIMPPLRS